MKSLCRFSVPLSRTGLKSAEEGAKDGKAGASDDPAMLARHVRVPVEGFGNEKQTCVPRDNQDENSATYVDGLMASTFFAL